MNYVSFVTVGCEENENASYLKDIRYENVLFSLS